MSPKDRIELDLIEKRTKLRELATADELTDEQRSEIGTLTNAIKDLETRQAAAIVAGEPEGEQETVEDEPTEDAKAKEFRELREGIRMSHYVAAAMEQRSVDGKEAEYNAEVGLKATGAFPLELLAPAVEVRDEGADLETRATTDTDTTKTPRRWLDRLFAGSMATRLGITMESVEPGIPTFPITTAGAAAAQRARQEAAEDGAWTIGVSELKPTRNAVRVVFSEEDAMRLPTLEEALRRDLNMALVEGTDRDIFVGDATAQGNDADITGLTTAQNVVEKTITQANKVKGPETLATFLELVDGIHAEGLESLNVVATVGTYRLWAGTIANAAAENQTVAQFLRANGLSWGVRGSIEDATAANKWGAFVGRNRGIVGAGVAAVWNSGMLIRDPYTGAKTGEVALTLSYFWNLGFPRPANFARVKFVA